jgi:hypothetical protein
METLKANDVYAKLKTAAEKSPNFVVLTSSTFEDDPEWGFAIYLPNERSEGIGICVREPSWAKNRDKTYFQISYIDAGTFGESDEPYPLGGCGVSTYFRCSNSKMPVLLEALQNPSQFIQTKLVDVSPDIEWKQRHGIESMSSREAQYFGSELLECEIAP